MSSEHLRRSHSATAATAGAGVVVGLKDTAGGLLFSSTVVLYRKNKENKKILAVSLDVLERAICGFKSPVCKCM